MTDHIDTAQERDKLAALSGFTPGPWSSFIDDSGGEWSGWPLSIGPASDDNKTVVRTGGQWPYEWDAKTSQYEACQNARLIAAAPDLLALAHRLLDALDAERVEREQGQRDYCDLMTRHDAHFSMWQLTKVRAEKAEEKVKLDAITLETQAEIIRRMKAERGQALARLAAVQRETLDRCAAIGFNCDYEAQGAHGLALEISSVVIDSDAEAALQKLLDAKFNAGLTAATELVAHDYICEAIRALKRPEASHE